MHRDPPSIFRTISRPLLCSLFLPLLLPLLRQLWPCVTCRGEGKVCRVTGMHGRGCLNRHSAKSEEYTPQRRYKGCPPLFVYCLFLSAVLFYEPNLFKEVSLSTSSVWNPQIPCRNGIVFEFLLGTLNFAVCLDGNIYSRLMKSCTMLCTLLEAVVSFEHLLSGQKCRIIKCQMPKLAHIRSQ